MWKIVKKIKLGTPYNKRCSIDGLYRKKESSNLEVEKEMGIESSEMRFENMTVENINIAGELFIYLNTCPGNFDNDMDMTPNQIWFQKWFRFYHDLFKTRTPYQILLTLNRVMKINSKQQS